MTRPTQAQIEANEENERLRYIVFRIVHNSSVPKAIREWVKNELGLSFKKEGSYSFTAQVGEPRGQTLKDLQAIRSATIERCAQVVKAIAEKQGRYGCDPYARAQLELAEENIRKLKDAP